MRCVFEEYHTGLWSVLINVCITRYIYIYIVILPTANHIFKWQISALVWQDHRCWWKHVFLRFLALIVASYILWVRCELLQMPIEAWWRKPRSIYVVRRYLGVPHPYESIYKKKRCQNLVSEKQRYIYIYIVHVWEIACVRLLCCVAVFHCWCGGFAIKNMFEWWRMYVERHHHHHHI